MRSIVQCKSGEGAVPYRETVIPHPSPLPTGEGAYLRCRSCSTWHEKTYAMNMRAAEAIVSNAPKAMKIFPIREVSSQVEPSLVAAGAGGGFAVADDELPS